MLTKRPLAPFIALYLFYIAALDKVPVSTHLYYMHTYIYVRAHKAATRALHCSIPLIHCCARHGTCFNAFVLYIYMYICTCSQSNYSRPSLHYTFYTICPRQGNYLNAYILDTYIYMYMLTKWPLAPFHALCLVYVAALDRGVPSTGGLFQRTYIGYIHW